MATALPQTGSVIARWSADDITPQTDNTTLQTWTDSVGSIAATQATSGLRPLYRTNRIGSKPSLSFPGGKVLQVGRPTALVNAINAQAITLFVVWRDLGTSSDGFLFDFGSNDTGSALKTNGTQVGRFSDAVSGTIPFADQTKFSTIGWIEDIAYVNGGITGLERLYVNGGGVATSNGISSGLGATGNIAIGADYANAAFVNVNSEYFDIVIWNRALTPTEMLQCQMWACDKYSQPYPWASKDRFTIFHGDSITAGIGATDCSGTYPYQAAQLLGLSYGQWSNLGIGGDTIAEMGTRAANEVDNVYALIGKPVAVAAFEWYNQSGASPTPENASVTYLNARRSAHVKVAFGTSTDNTDASPGPVNRAAYNNYFDNHSNSVTMDAYVAIHNDAHVGMAGATSAFPANFYDGVHLTSAGYGYLAALFAAGLRQLTFPAAPSFPQRSRRRRRKADTYDFSGAGWFSLAMVSAAQFDKDMVAPSTGAGTPVGLATETDAALGLGSARPAGLASEADSALAAAGVQKRLAGQSSETNTALALTALQIKATGLSTEASSALALSGTQLRATGQSSETDSALALAAKQIKAIGLATETDAALALSPGAGGGVGLAAETDSALALSGVQLRATGNALETDAALALAAIAVRPTGLATETDAAQALARLQVRAVGLSSESDAALALAPGSHGAAGTAVETDAALALAGLQRLPVGMAVESDSAAALALVQARGVGMASEADAALALARKLIQAIGMAVETDTAVALIHGQMMATGLALETDSAFALPPLRRIQGRPGIGSRQAVDEQERIGRRTAVVITERIG